MANVEFGLNVVCAPFGAPKIRSVHVNRSISRKEASSRLLAAAAQFKIALAAILTPEKVSAVFKTSEALEGWLGRLERRIADELTAFASGVEAHSQGGDALDLDKFVGHSSRPRESTAELDQAVEALVKSVYSCYQGTRWKLNPDRVSKAIMAVARLEEFPEGVCLQSSASDRNCAGAAA